MKPLVKINKSSFLKPSKSFLKKLSIAGTISLGAIFLTACYVPLKSTDYHFNEIHSQKDLEFSMSNWAKNNADKPTGFLLDLSTSACPVCLGLRDLNQSYFDYFWSHSSSWTVDKQSDWLKSHGTGNGPLNDYASGNNGIGTKPIDAHNVSAILIPGYKLEDPDGFNFQNNILYNWIYLLINNQYQLKHNEKNEYFFEEHKPGSQTFDQGYDGYLNNNIINSKTNHWYYDSKPKDKTQKPGWVRGYAEGDNNWYGHWPLLVWFTFNSSPPNYAFDGEKTNSVGYQWYVSGWTSGYNSALRMQDLSKTINAGDTNTNAVQEIQKSLIKYNFISSFASYFKD